MNKRVKVIALLKARSDMSLEEFKRYWLEDHAQLNKKFKNLKEYRVNIHLNNYPPSITEFPYDGSAELWWDSLEEMQEDFNSEEGMIAGKDADSFTAQRIHLYTEEFIIIENKS